MTVEESLAIVSRFINNGWEIGYDTISQFEEGHGDSVIAGEMPAFTVTSHVEAPGCGDRDDIYQLSASFDSLTEMYLWLGATFKKIEVTK
ncbi:hypothetical protein [Levilactobacillus enshiensis]|uniref:hypothetical protein n=1 Tax=Levilactobacillus enshiensis TaxID=2590213 RepID=UPI00117B77CC|nr:hypothetical protein [Levilactobacillus enshiensis]